MYASIVAEQMKNKISKLEKIRILLYQIYSYFVWGRGVVHSYIEGILDYNTLTGKACASHEDPGVKSVQTIYKFGYKVSPLR